MTKTASNKNKLPSKKSIIKGPKSSWILFLEEQRKQSRFKDVKFGDICKTLSIEWKEIDPLKKEKFINMCTVDRDRYNNQLKSLSDEEIKLIKTIKRHRKKNRPKKPKAPFSAYMIFVTEIRKGIVEENPGITFQEIGKLLGSRWRSLPNDIKSRYINISKQNRENYKSKLQEENKNITKT